MRRLAMNHWTSFSCLLAIVATACAAPDDAEPAESPISSVRTELALTCDRDGASVKLVATKRDGAFDLTATTSDGSILFGAAGKVPSLSVRLEDGTSSEQREFVDFSDKGLVSVPVDGPKAIELDLFGAKSLHYKDEATSFELACRFDVGELQRFLALDLVSTEQLEARVADAKVVAFDIDDTLAYTTPAFLRGGATGGTPVPDDVLFWTQTNGCDLGCSAQTLALPDGTSKSLPANAPSKAKAKALELISFHKARGARVYAITARPDINGDRLRDFVEQELGIARADVFFEPDIDQPGNPKGKTDRIESLRLDVFYGDSDTDITDARNITAVRFLRSPKSSNRKAGKLNKYHPGYYGEPVLRDSYE
jgi:acid phosphatase class B